MDTEKLRKTRNHLISALELTAGTPDLDDLGLAMDDLQEALPLLEQLWLQAAKGKDDI